MRISRNFRFWILVLLLGSLPALTLAYQSEQDFRAAKKLLSDRVYYDHRVTFYCGCNYDQSRQVKPYSCGYQARRPDERSRRIEWEHLVPAATFGRAFSCWQNARQICGRGGGRKCCEKTDATFRRLEADMHNLGPAIGELNADRENFPFGEIPGEARRYGRCDFEVSGGVAEPMPAVRGDVARATLYMDSRLSALRGRGFLTGREHALFLAWDRTDSPDQWECERERRITRLQGNSNPFVSRGCR